MIMKAPTRRTFSTLLASSPLAFAQQAPNPNTAEQRRGTLPAAPPFEGPLAFTRQPVAAKLQPFPMTQVRLTASPFKAAAEANRAYMDRLSADRLTRNFKLNVGLPTSAEPLGGWEESIPGRAGELRGHFTGHYLSACALSYASTSDVSIKAKGDAMVDDLAKCQSKLSGGYLSAFPTEWFDRLDARKPVWAPFYTIHKIMAGMFDMYTLAGNKQALEVLQGMANWADDYTKSKPEAHMQDILNTEYGGMNEVLYNLAGATGDDRWAQVGDRFTKKVFFNPLASRRDELRGLHVNTHIPQVIGAARRYELSGDMRFHDVADYFWYEVVSARSYVTGGTSNGEGWLAQPRQLAAELKQSVSTAECCCAYNMMKLTRQLYSWTGDPRYFDYYERALFNHRLGTIRADTGATQYYLSLTPGAWKTFNFEDKSFWCCTGTGVEEFSKLNDSIYWKDDHGVYVNLFIASDLNWQEKGFRLRQETKFPDVASTTLHIAVDKPVQLALNLRIPEWLTGGSIKINGKAIDASASPGSYLTLSRLWKSGDRIEMDLPMRLRVEAMPDDPKTQAVLYGPIVLAGDLGTKGLGPELIVGPSQPQIRKAGPIDIPSLEASAIKPGDQPLTFQMNGTLMLPLSRILDRRYTVYWQTA
jgi:uncharacterized protein